VLIITLEISQWNIKSESATSIDRRKATGTQWKGEGGGEGGGWEVETRGAKAFHRFRDVDRKDVRRVPST